MNWLGKKELHGTHGVALPWYYGLAYRYDFAHVVVCYPVPLNWLVWVAQECWFRLRCPPDGIVEKAYRHGYHKGTIDGKLDGWLLGYDAAKAPPQLENSHSSIRDDSQHPLNRLARGERVL